MQYLNLGCGARYHEEWLNFDFVSHSTFVKQTNLTDGIPIADKTIDFVYHSHILEHFTKIQGAYFLEECYRVLKDGGILRVVIPDLEQIAINYLSTLKVVLEDENQRNIAKYNWSTIELLDQMVREESGGEMLRVWKQKELVNEDQIIDRVGDEFVRIRKNILKNSNNNEKINSSKKSFGSILKNFFLKKLKVEEENLKAGNFRNGGEVHKWMYDRFSLKNLLQEVGFKDVKIVNAFESDILNWEKFQSLDVQEGKVRKPDSLFMEAKK